MIPPSRPVAEEDYQRLRALVAEGGVTALTGAGMSTASGIPDYRGPDGSRRVQPMQYAEFLASAENRRRYWARSYVGWSRFRAAGPNEAHAAVAALQRSGHVEDLITQNVDGLHQAAGSTGVIELHGNLNDIVCLNCGERFERGVVHGWIAEANPGFTAESDQIRPDGDVVLAAQDFADFRLVRCVTCGSDLLKPDVVFFGGSVAKPVVERAYAAVESADALLVLGSSLQVMSGLRFVKRAHALGIPVAVVTRWATRGDEWATLRIDGLLQDVLPRLVDDCVTEATTVP
nr:NAD-dependent protein deacetylase [Ornithinimicrobium sp. F0845]